jgi:hypothetical protein
LALSRTVWLLRLLLLFLLPSRRRWLRLRLCARSLLLPNRRTRFASYWSRFATHLWLRPLLRHNYSPLLLLLLRSRWCCDSFALRLLLSHRSSGTFSLRRTCCTLYSTLFVLLTSLLLLNAPLVTLRGSRVTLRLSRLSLLLRSNWL